MGLCNEVEGPDSCAPLNSLENGNVHEHEERWEYGKWFDERVHPPIRKRFWHLEVEMRDSGGAWTYKDWRQHQSWRRYLLQPKPLLRSVFMELPLLVMVACATVFAGLYYELYQSKTPGALVLVSRGYFLPYVGIVHTHIGWMMSSSKLQLLLGWSFDRKSHSTSLLFHILHSYYYLAVPLSLLLVFRTHVSYSRWWEARQTLGDQQNTLRNAARLVVAWVWPGDPDLGANIVRLLAFLAPSSGSWFRHELEPMMANRDLVSDEELGYVVGCDQPAVAVCAMVSQLLCTAEIATYERCVIEQELSKFMNTIGVLNRLSTMPLYLSYCRNCVRNLMWFMFGLPFALFESMGWMTVVAVIGSTILIASIENLSTQIENPLLVLPVKTITSNTRRHVEATLTSRQRLSGKK